MGVRGLELLERLGSGVRPEGLGASRSAGALDGKSFASLLSDVRAGKVSSGRPVELGPHADVELSAEQLSRLSVVADAGEAAGATRLAALIDGQVVTLDLLTRTVEGRVDGGEVLTGIDGFVVAPEADATGDLGGLFGGAVGGLVAGIGGGNSGTGLDVVRNRSVAELLGAIGVGGGDDLRG